MNASGGERLPNETRDFSLDVIGLDVERMDLTASDLARSSIFYSRVPEALAFRRFDRLTPGRTKLTITLRSTAPVPKGAEFSRFHLGLPYLAFKQGMDSMRERRRWRWQ